jgi:hypothetical protein
VPYPRSERYRVGSPATDSVGDIHVGCAAAEEGAERRVDGDVVRLVTTPKSPIIKTNWPTPTTTWQSYTRTAATSRRRSALTRMPWPSAQASFTTTQT